MNSLDPFWGDPFQGLGPCLVRSGPLTTEEEPVSRKTDLFLAAKRVLRAHPGWDDQQVADHIGSRMIECEEILVQARRDLAADAMEQPG